MQCQPSAWTLAQATAAQTSSTSLVCQAASASTPRHWIRRLLQAVYNDHEQLVQQQLVACVAQTQIPVAVDGWMNAGASSADQLQSHSALKPGRSQPSWTLALEILISWVHPSNNTRQRIQTPASAFQAWRFQVLQCFWASRCLTWRWKRWCSWQ